MYSVGRDHHRRQDHPEDEIAPGKPHLPEGKTGGRAGDDLTGRRHTGNEEAVPQVATEIVLPEDLLVVEKHLRREESIGHEVGRQ